MNPSAIIMMVFASIVLFGGLVYFLYRASKGRIKSNSKVEIE